MLDLLTGGTPFAAFVGAGASAIPPSNLPTWNGFNNLLLESLCEQLGKYSGGRQPTAEILSMLRARRDNTRFFSPDFQAQLIEDQLGADYFRVWQSLESTAVSPAHEALAELCVRGRLAAIVTTNFDRLIEFALQARGQPYHVFHDVASFEALAAETCAGAIPVIKIHGSIEDPNSLVDTLRQRVAGRTAALQQVLDRLLRAHVWLYLGFSGADFSYDPNYLNVLGSADEARGFVFLAREGHRIEPGVGALIEAYGPQRSSIQTGSLERWLHQLFGLEAHKGTAASSPRASRKIVRGRIREWVRGLRPLSTVNVLHSMLAGCGRRADALWLMRKTWKSYRLPEDTEGLAYARYNFNYGTSLLEAGSISNPVTLAEDMSNVAEWKRGADQNAVEFLARAYQVGKLPVAGAYTARAWALRGEIAKAVALLAEVTDAALQPEPGLDFCDVAIASCDLYDILQMFQGPIDQLERGLQVVARFGDEPRRARLWLLRARFLTYARRRDEAAHCMDQAAAVADRLGLEDITLDLHAVRGMWMAEPGESRDQALAAVRLLKSVADTLRARDAHVLYTHVDLGQPVPVPTDVTGQAPSRCRVLLDLNQAALATGDVDVMRETLVELEPLVWEHFAGYSPHYFVAHAQCVASYGDGDVAAQVDDLLRRAEKMGETTGNFWVPQATAHFRERFAQRQGH